MWKRDSKSYYVHSHYHHHGGGGGKGGRKSDFQSDLHHRQRWGKSWSWSFLRRDDNDKQKPVMTGDICPVSGKILWVCSCNCCTPNAAALRARWPIRYAVPITVTPRSL